MSIASVLNLLDNRSLAAALAKCCASRGWIRQMAAASPFAGDDAVLAKAIDVWNCLDRDDYLEAFAAHPKIGDVGSLRAKFAGTRAWAAAEQAGVADAADDVLQRLSTLNAEYEKKFGYIFIVCATDKTADEMLSILESRLPHDETTELQIAAAEQLKITLIRLRKLAS